MNLNTAHFRKSSHSDANGGDCVEVATTADEFAVRDSTNRSGPVLVIPAIAGRQFIAGVKAGEFDLPT